MFKHPATIFSPIHFQLLKNISKSKNNVHQQGYKELQLSTKLDYNSNVIEKINIGPYGSGKGHDEFINDSIQSYQNCLLFIATNNIQYAQKSINIIDAWIKGCLSFEGSNAPLECAWGGTLLVRTIELLKYNYKDWNKNFERLFNKFLDIIILPNLKNRYNEIIKWNNNWILTILEALLQIALFRDNRDDFLWIINEFKKVLPLCINHDCGICTETKRDLIHTQFQIGSIIQICEMLYNQNIDLYNDRIYNCMEYHASILLGNIPKDISKNELKDVWFMSCVWDIGYNHYVNRKNKIMINTDKLLQKKRPEKITFNWGPAWLFYK